MADINMCESECTCTPSIDDALGKECLENFPVFTEDGIIGREDLVPFLCRPCENFVDKKRGRPKAKRGKSARVTCEKPLTWENDNLWSRREKCKEQSDWILKAIHAPVTARRRPVYLNCRDFGPGLSGHQSTCQTTQMK